LEKSDDAIAVYNAIDIRFGQDDSRGVREQVVSALFHKGRILGELGKSAEAIAIYDAVAQRFGQDVSLGTRKKVALALEHRSILLQNRS
jgi:TolA-binding protein